MKEPCPKCRYPVTIIIDPPHEMWQVGSWHRTCYLRPNIRFLLAPPLATGNPHPNLS